MLIQDIQERVRLHNIRMVKEFNIPEPTDVDMFEGISEEVGELARARLKKRQGIRGSIAEHNKNEKDAIGDILGFLCQYCTVRGLDLDTIMLGVLLTIESRDYNNLKKTEE